jgi:nitrogen fixation/metabolism regulation signal transduction histidine kinase
MCSDVHDNFEIATEVEARRLLHELRQPLNVMRLATTNIRNRIGPVLSSEDCEYLALKLERIERQIERTAQIAEAFLVPYHCD